MNGFSLSEYCPDSVVRDAVFTQTQFVNSRMTNSLCYVGHEKYLEQALNNRNISCVITTDALAGRIPDGLGLAVAAYPEEVFYKLHNRLYLDGLMHPDMTFSIDDSAVLHPSAIISEKVRIGKNVVVGPNAVIESYCHLADNVTVGPGAIIGASGHYYKRCSDGLLKVEHAGGVWLESGAQILAGSIVSKSVHPDFTVIGEETVVSINSHVGHGCSIGRRCTITGCVQIAGFTNIGDDVWIGPSATIGNLRTIGNGARIEIGSVVIRDVMPGERVSGNYAIPHAKHIRDLAARLRK